VVHLVIVTMVTGKETALLTREPRGRGIKPIRRDTRSKWSAWAWNTIQRKTNKIMYKL